MNARTLLLLLALPAAGAANACGDEGTTPINCPEGTIRAGDVCIDNSGDVIDTDTGGVDAGDDTTEADTATDAAADTATDTTTDTGGTDTATDTGGTDTGSGAQIIVDEFFGPSGYFGEYCNIQAVECPSRADGAAGGCHGFTWTAAGECEPGGEAGFAGVYWQYPDGNWGDAPGLPMPATIDAIQFSAWGAEGGESVNFLAGYDSDGASGETGALPLSATPTRYTINLPGAGGEEIAGGFGWVAANGTTTFYVDDIRFVSLGSDVPDAGTDTGGSDAGTDTEGPDAPASLPVVVDAWFGPSGYMGEFNGITDAPCADGVGPADAVGNCHQFTWTPLGAEGWAGVWWQNPDGNWGDLPGLPFPDGATAVRFSAWGEQGGEIVSFAAGYDVDPVNGSTGAITLGTEPTEYSITFTGTIDAIKGGFSWTADGRETDLVFYVDDIRWE